MALVFRRSGHVTVSRCDDEAAYLKRLGLVILSAVVTTSVDDQQLCFAAPVPEQLSMGRTSETRAAKAIPAPQTSQR